MRELVQCFSLVLLGVFVVVAGAASRGAAGSEAGLAVVALGTVLFASRVRGRSRLPRAIAVARHAGALRRRP